MHVTIPIWEKRLLTEHYQGISDLFFAFFADITNSLRILLMYTAITIFQWCSSIKDIIGNPQVSF